MDKYRSDAKCPKCGNDDICDQSIEKGQYYNLMDKRPWCKSSIIRRHCRNCGYEWEEKPLDEESPNEPNH